MKKYQKISAFAAVLIIVAGIITSCGASPVTITGFKKISDDGVSYDLFVPDEWIADISTGVTSAYYSSLDTSNISVMAFELAM